MADNLTTQQSGSDDNLTGFVPSWVQEFGTNGYDSSETIAMDGEGNVYVTGITEGDLGSINNGEGDIWLSKYDSNGNQLWIKQWGTAFADAPNDLSVDRDGNIYIAARTLALQDEGFYANEYALIKYDTSGNLLSVDSQPQMNTLKEIEVDGAGNLYTLGLAEDKWLVSKNNSNGDRLWFQEFNSSVGGTFERLSNLTVNNQGDVYLGKSITLDAIFTETINRIVKYSSAGTKQWFKDFWDGFLPDINSDSQGNLYAFGNGELIKYNPNGNLQWEYQWEDKDGWQFSEEVGVDRNGNVYLLVNLGGPEAEFIKLDTTGDELWKQPLNLTKSIAEIEVDGDGTVYLTGRSRSDLSNLDFDAWVGKFDAIAPVNEAPTNITLSENSIAENSATGTVIGELTTTDTDSEIHTYTLVNDAEGRFVIEGDRLKVADGSKLDFEATTSHTIKIRTADSGEPAQSFEKELLIEVTDVEDNTVTSTTNYRLEATKENLNLVGEDAINGIGNNLDNRISGNNAKNRIWGKDGNDVLIGRGGRDVLIGNEGSDRLIGNRGNDLLNGGKGIDTLIGGPGNDTYMANHTKDVVTEGTNRGTDVVKSSASYNLGANIENLNLVGRRAINGIGNNLDNRISGNNAKNRIIGKSGDDVLIGRGGRDVLIGDKGSDRLIGNQGNDMLNGGVGNDTLIGGGGSDRFIFNTGKSYRQASPGKDLIRDFKNRDNDKIILDKTTFGTLDSKAGRGFSVIAEFDVVNRDAVVASSDAVIVYNENNGKLFYNANGSKSGLGAGGVFAVLDDSPQLQANDFIVRT